MGSMVVQAAEFAASVVFFDVLGRWHSFGLGW